MFSAFDNIVFDLDGTLLDSASGVLAFLEKTIEETGMAADKKKLNRDLIGPPLEKMLQTLCPFENPESLSSAIRTFRRIYDTDPASGCTVFHQSVRLLKNLRIQNKRLFIATNKPKIPALDLIGRLGLGSFEAVFTPDMVDGKRLTKTEMIQELISRFNLNKARTVMIGDTVLDMTAAHAAGIKGIAVLWGYEQDKDRLRSEADFIFRE